MFFRPWAVSLDEGSATLTVVFVAPPSPSRHCRDESAYGHTTTATRDNEHTPPQGRSIPHLDGLAHVAGWEPSNLHDVRRVSCVGSLLRIQIPHSISQRPVRI